MSYIYEVTIQFVVNMSKWFRTKIQCKGVFTVQKILRVYGLYILDLIMFVKQMDLLHDSLLTHTYATPNKNVLKSHNTKCSFIQRNELSIKKKIGM